MNFRTKSTEQNYRGSNSHEFNVRVKQKFIYNIVIFGKRNERCEQYADVQKIKLKL